MPRKAPPEKELIRPEEPKLIRSSGNAMLPKNVICPHERTEEYEATRPDGEQVHIWRCIDCGAMHLSTKE